jgi:ribosomal protein S18 acetylase RimI-like enzyme
MDRTFDIRPLQSSDIPGLARWVAATPLWQRYGVTETSFAGRLSEGLAGGATIYVAAETAAVAGFIWLITRGAFNRSGYVQLIGVRAGDRGRGVGQALMEFAERELSAQAIADIFLLVSDFNREARRFYGQLGYRQVGALDDYVVPGVSECIYWKRLTPHPEK